MSNSAKSVFVFGIYLVVLGLSFLLIPNVVLGLFGFPETTEIWIRVVGMLLVLSAFYYTQAARKELTDFFKFTVYARSSVIVFFVIFVIFGHTRPIIILFGAIDLLAAIWTGLTLKSVKK